jgi:hypothetical protein
MDINPSLCYSLNAFDKVIKMEAFNEDGQDIVDAVGSEVKWQKLDKAVSITLNGLESANYIAEETEAVFTVGSHLPRHERLEKEILGSVDDWNRDRKEHGDEKHVNAEAIEATRELKDKARKQHLSPGRIYMDEHKKPDDPDNGHNMPKAPEGTGPDIQASPYEAIPMPEEPSQEGNAENEPSDDRKAPDHKPEGGYDVPAQETGHDPEPPKGSDPYGSTGRQDTIPDNAGTGDQRVPDDRSEGPDIPAPQSNEQNVDPGKPGGGQAGGPVPQEGGQNSSPDPQENGQNVIPGPQEGGQNVIPGPQEGGQNVIPGPQEGGQNNVPGPQEGGHIIDPGSQEGRQNVSPGSPDVDVNTEPGRQEHGHNAGPGPQGGQNTDHGPQGGQAAPPF